MFSDTLGHEAVIEILLSKEKFDLVGSSINPYSREEPSEFIQTGMSNNKMVFERLWVGLGVTDPYKNDTDIHKYAISIVGYLLVHLAGIK